MTEQTPPKTFLHRYLELNAGTEIPESFALWSGLCSLSVVMGRNVYMDMGTYKIYPNLYVILVAGSGKCRKSTAIGVMEKLVQDVTPPPKLIAQKITTEGLIQTLRDEPKQPGVVKLSTKPRNPCDGFVIVDEMAMFLNKKSHETGLSPLLIQLFDCKSKIVYTTKTHGDEVLENTCLGMLSASTFDWLKNAFNEESIGSGLTSRIIFVYVQEPPPPVAITSFSKKKEMIQGKLKRRLNAIRKIKGVMRFSTNGALWYENWYNKFYEESELYENKTLSGYASRRGVHMIKIAMLIAGSHKTLQITEHHLITADALLAKAEIDMPSVMSLIITNDTGANAELVLRIIGGHGRISRSNLMQRVCYKLNAQELDLVISTLKTSRQILEIQSTKGNQIWYQKRAKRKKQGA